MCVSWVSSLCVLGAGSCILVLSLGVWVQDPWKHACTQAGVHTQAPPPTPQPSSLAEQAQGYPRAVSPDLRAPEAGPHPVTELEGSEQQEGPRGRPVYSPVGSVQSLRPQESARQPSPPAVRRLARMRGIRPFHGLPALTCSSCIGAGLGAATGICPVGRLPGRPPGVCACGQEWVLHSLTSPGEGQGRVMGMTGPPSPSESSDGPYLSSPSRLPPPQLVCG